MSDSDSESDYEEVDKGPLLEALEEQQWDEAQRLLEADPAAIAAWGERPVALASGFLRTLGQDRVDLDAVCEVLARSAAARR